MMNYMKIYKKKEYVKYVNINFVRMILSGYVGLVKLMKHVYYVMIAFKIHHMMDMKSIFIIHKLVVVVIVVMLGHGNQKDFVQNMVRQLMIHLLGHQKILLNLVNFSYKRLFNMSYNIVNNMSRLSLLIPLWPQQMSCIHYVSIMMMCTQLLKLYLPSTR